jgi:multiple sugar transport system ATP-binding protein
MSTLTLRNVKKRYGKVEAVRGFSMDIADGEFIAFLGPSGCGKSSTMRMIAGLEEVSEGDILLNGESIVDKKPGERNVSMAFENYALYPTLSVYENLAFPLRAAGWKEAELDARVREVGGVVGIAELFERKPGGLSSGQAQSVGLARALIRKPNVFLLDEPISHLDTSQRVQMRMYIKRLHIELGYTMILVTHDQEDAMSLADRIAVMSDGKLNQIDTPRKVYDDPADLFVAGFIGDIPMNFMDARVSREGGRTYLANGSLRIELPRGKAREELPEELVLGVRPYNLRVAGEGAGTIPAEVFVVEPMGDMNVVSVNVGEQRFQVVAPTDFRARPGTGVRLSIDAERVLLFDKASGKSLGTRGRA